MFEWSITMYICHIILMNTVQMQYKSYQVAVSYMLGILLHLLSLRLLVEHVDGFLVSCNT